MFIRGRRHGGRAVRDEDVCLFWDVAEHFFQLVFVSPKCPMPKFRCPGRPVEEAIFNCDGLVDEDGGIAHNLAGKIGIRFKE